MTDVAVLRVPLNGYAMQLRASELESVAAGLRHLEEVPEAAPFTLAEALQHLPANDRAPAWELAVRRFGRAKDLPQAASEIGMDLVHATDLLDTYFQAMAAVQTPYTARPPEAL